MKLQSDPKLAGEAQWWEDASEHERSRGEKRRGAAVDCFSSEEEGRQVKRKRGDTAEERKLKAVAKEKQQRKTLGKHLARLGGSVEDPRLVLWKKLWAIHAASVRKLILDTSEALRNLSCRGPLVAALETALAPSLVSAEEASGAMLRDIIFSHSHGRGLCGTCPACLERDCFCVGRKRKSKRLRPCMGLARAKRHKAAEASAVDGAVAGAGGASPVTRGGEGESESGGEGGGAAVYL